jgi:hypothetical protein
VATRVFSDEELEWLGFVPDDVAAAPPAAVAQLAERLRVPADALGRYGEREQTRTEHLWAAARYLGWRPAKALELKELEEFLLDRLLVVDPQVGSTRLHWLGKAPTEPSPGR